MQPNTDMSPHYYLRMYIDCINISVFILICVCIYIHSLDICKWMNYYLQTHTTNLFLTKVQFQLVQFCKHYVISSHFVCLYFLIKLLVSLHVIAVICIYLWNSQIMLCYDTSSYHIAKNFGGLKFVNFMVFEAPTKIYLLKIS